MKRHEFEELLKSATRPDPVFSVLYDNAELTFQVYFDYVGEFKYFYGLNESGHYGFSIKEITDEGLRVFYGVGNLTLEGFIDFNLMDYRY